MEKEKLSSKVNNKDFHVELEGYKAIEVDSYLDSIVEEIASLENEIASLNSKIEELNYQLKAKDNKITSLNLELSNIKASNNVSQSSSANLSNIDLYNRIADIEAMVKKILDNQNLK